MAIMCPQCNELNSDYAVRCACGGPLGEADALEDWAASVLGGSAQAEGEVPADAEDSATAKVCPQCNRFNPGDSVRCSCGCPLGEADSFEDWAASVLGGSAQAEGEVPADAEDSATAKVCPQCNLSNAGDAVQCRRGCPLGEADSSASIADASEDLWSSDDQGKWHGPVASSDGAATGPVKVPKPRGTLANAASGPDGAAPWRTTPPKPLDDPLRALRHVVAFLLILVIACFVITLPSLLFDAKRATFLYALGLFMPVFLAGTFWLWSILPGRAVNAFYLRSFRNDPATWPIRKAAQAALGRTFRLSGIRDPRKRWPLVIRYMHAVFFAIRCCTPRFMNLEAGADWKARRGAPSGTPAVR